MTSIGKFFLMGAALALIAQGAASTPAVPPQIPLDFHAQQSVHPPRTTMKVSTHVVNYGAPDAQFSAGYYNFDTETVTCPGTTTCTLIIHALSSLGFPSDSMSESYVVVYVDNQLLTGFPGGNAPTGGASATIPFLDYADVAHGNHTVAFYTSLSSGTEYQNEWSVDIAIGRP